MALILNIDTATEYATISIAQDAVVLHTAATEEQKNHASFVQPAIEQLLQQSGYSLQQLDAVAVMAGPGSYTGLRVGLSTAKGLCYALNKPLVMVGTLEVMALAAIEAYAGKPRSNRDIIFCPMIDARRMEVFTAIYNDELQALMDPTAMILVENSFHDFASSHIIVFSGSGSSKYKTLVSNPNSVDFLDVRHSASHMATLSERAVIKGLYADLAYSEPFYLKEFFSTTQRP
ncbi:tRNA (adenosine(37)-N6)-threonylcarbamoyltransferase complex dimerization subunit type 1 TsaB [Deminuibacter soli]|uniref:tRNA (Adenosine(37)-N6)-threonylcarbamoyltransferase complex dimerization subunit type 1 TsaB n=1 Tax=Deminuibacter soli TaxID=2291815 RepID=A0A3E1NPK7_9BACT|nr:tRNA (adenosine(37)-N6)-threonylcarbamoyltransferase complex dimerization subunit type 1 TsaB [Deminuibacter soli]RFM29862.1 tRNA (adenosine(37)-N6)-threonylcarbamoyltransferase complex dimerization subunit type 1 TsaB [Deminuibacter soli]